MSNSVNIKLESKTVEAEQVQLNSREAAEDLAGEIDSVVLQQLLSYDLVGNPSFSGAVLKMKRTRQELKEYYEKRYVDKHVPFTIERHDGEILIMNNDFETYSFVSNIFNNYGVRNRYLLITLIVTYENDFKVIGYAPIDDLFNNSEKYFTYDWQIVNNNRIKL